MFQVVENFIILHDKCKLVLKSRTLVWIYFKSKDRHLYNLDNKISKNYIMFEIIYDYISLSLSLSFSLSLARSLSLFLKCNIIMENPFSVLYTTLWERYSS